MSNLTNETSFGEASDVREQRPTVVVSALTCHRSETLERLLQEFQRMELPLQFRTVLLIVDNDKDGSAQELVASYQEKIDNLRYVIEPRPGIPVARNRALDEAVAMDGSALCFIDDDEYPDEKWLIRLVDHWQKTGASLVGGPVNVAPADASYGPVQKLINRSLAARQFRKNRAAAEWPERGRRPTIVTNNWLCDLDWARQSGVRFDESLLVTGGSDTDFYRKTLQMGGESSWCSEAVVYEIMGPGRLTLKYQFWRGASQSITHFHFKHQTMTPKLAFMTTLGAVLRFILGGLLMLFPVLGVASLVMATRSMGWAVGRLQAMFGLRSRLYEHATESKSESVEHTTAPQNAGSRNAA
ncbi:MAG: glycosyltransferase [Planctomycetota bacterium]|nr:glycosyltransferase [Planctomycetota bacterium]